MIEEALGCSAECVGYHCTCQMPDVEEDAMNEDVEIVDVCPHCGSENELHDGEPMSEERLWPEADSSRKEEQYADLRS